MLDIIIGHNGGATRKVSAKPGTPFLHLLFEAGIARGRALCAGAGLCGKCRIRFASSAPAPQAEESARLSVEDIADGWRLACRHVVTEACRVDVAFPVPAAVIAHSGEELAVDIGTTRIKWAVQSGGGRGQECAVSNPQMGVGAEVMSRLRYALSSPQARAFLRESVVEVLRDLARQSGATKLGIAGNSVMISLLLGVSLEGMAFAPYSLPWPGGRSVLIDESLPPAYIPPLLGPFVGADVSAGLALIMSTTPEYPFLLADLGTNGEFVLACSPDRFLACSVPMGPAIEGVGLCCGTVAGENVLSRVEFGPHGLRLDCGSPKGISGTGYVSLFSMMRRLGVMDESGHFQQAAMPLARKVGQSVREHPLGRVFWINEDTFVAERDVEEFLKAKAAVNVALRTLIECAGLVEADLRRIYVAGALGEYADCDDLITLGFFPERWRHCIEIVGNTSLAGVLLSLHDDGIRAWLDALPDRVRIENLVERHDFGRRFLEAMRFVWV